MTYIYRSIVLLLFLISGSAAFGQFTSIIHPVDNTFYFAEVDESNGTAIAAGIRAAKSLDGGYTWTEMPLGALGLPSSLYVYVDGVVISPGVYCMIGYDNTNKRANIIRTTDGGGTWTQVLVTATNSYDFLTNIDYNGSTVITTGDDGIYRSVDGGISWSYVSISNGDSDLLQYNPVSGHWLTRYGFTGYRYSDDEGLTWNNISTIDYFAGTTPTVTNDGSNWLITYSSSTSNMLQIDQNYNSLDTITLSPTQMQQDQVYDAYYLPSSEMILSGVGNFMKVDTSNNQVYFYNHNLVDPTGGSLVATNDFNFDQTYGIAVGEYGGLSRFDPSAPEDLYLPGTFTLTSIACPGDSLFADADFPYADSIHWYFDGNLVSTDSNLAYVTPYQFGTFDVVMHSFMTGTLRGDTMSVTFNPLNPAPTYTATLDTTPCFNDDTYVNISYVNGTVWNSTFEVWLDDQLMYGPVTAPTSNVTFWTPIIDSQDTLYIVTDYPQNCGTTYDSTMYIIYPGDDLSDDYLLLDNDSLVCSGDTTFLQLINTDPLQNYLIESSQGFGNNYSGVTGDTINVVGSSLVNNWDFMNVNPVANTYITYTISISDDNNCSLDDVPLDTFNIVNPNAYYFPHSYAYYLNDTLQLTNVNIEENRMWTVSPNGMTVNNPTDVTPEIFGSTVGIFDIELINTPLPGCADTMNQLIHYADSMTQFSPEECWQEVGGEKRNITKVMFDHDGNILELGVQQATTMNNTLRPGFHLTKRAPDGTILWQKASPLGWSVYFYGCPMEDIDVDGNGDIYAAMWICGEQTFNYEQITFFEPPGLGGNVRNYIVKLDGQTGDMIWYKEMTNVLVNPHSIKMSDILIADNRIYFSATNTGTQIIGCTDMNGNFLDSELFGANYAFSNYMLTPNGTTGGGDQSYLSPELMQLNSGEIIAVSNFGSNLSYQGNYITELYPPTGSNSWAGIMACKYDPSVGLYDFTRLATTPYADWGHYARESEPFFDIDKDDNITFSFNFQDSDSKYYVKDSLIPLTRGTCIFQVDENFDINWITLGNYSLITDLHVAEQTGEVFVAGGTECNLSLTTGNESYMLGEDSILSTPYNTNLGAWDLWNYEYRTKDLYLVKLDTLGRAVAGSYFDKLGYSANLPEVKCRIETTPCGEVIAVFNNSWAHFNDSVLIDSESMSYIVDSSITVKLATDCLLECEYLAINYDTITVCGTQDSVFIDFSSSYGVNGVDFILYENGLPGGSQNASLSGQGFYVSTPNQGANYEVEITSPIQHTVTIVNIAPITPNVIVDYTICDGDQQSLVVQQSGLSYTWNNSVSNTAFIFDQTYYSVGQNQVTLAGMDGNGCQFADTFNILVSSPIQSTMNSAYGIDCGDTLIIPFNTNAFTLQNWTINGSASTNLFHDGNLNVGFNTAEVYLVDTNDCAHTEQITIAYCLTSLVDLEGGDNMILYPNPNNSNFTLSWSGSEHELVNVSMYDVKKKCVYQQSYKNTRLIDIQSDLVPGVYMIVVEIDGIVERRRVIVQ